MNWHGVMPAMTTCFDSNLQVDHAFMTRHAQWLLENGCTGIVSLGSLGEAATLAFDEKTAILKTIVAAVNGRAPVVAAISALSTSRGRRPRQSCGESRLLRPDGSPTLRLPG